MKRVDLTLFENVYREQGRKNASTEFNLNHRNAVNALMLGRPHTYSGSVLETVMDTC
jgi:hypothetical protein